MSEHTNPQEFEKEEILDQNQDSQTEQSSKQNTSSEEHFNELLQKEKDQYLRLFAEFDNYKKRTNKERIEISKTANKEVILALLPVLDDFQRALPTIEETADEATFKGVELIHLKIIDILRKKGLKPMEVNVGDNFSTDIHEAVTQIPAASEEMKGKIVDIIETGYTLSDVVIRYPKVVVGM
ncbi:nucleotide exchange factor GrpE [Weeksella virosa]|uniref:Protein GrpE n=1 Tax=Weeksella virosa (strain ATCC 43766 / DSM 16922 / JCM 21250 / CCUG 30538 / CDC 9751 / IAM 14551 / NBRC 16016 / NCTC 11634 / CL345/78) TaxID=865938 RepID=F0P0Y5_WEEVC|nr:nucleotide exchange factor GrpE [Weeksella virosa]ADX68569.1 Protein grpE [Weeksella virosa DSM 16922]MDK7675259.1 nucleotide exchange factor GrpE [Weeksella virosa]SUP54906.1 HSP-70 cofactor [Weeksella virosa]VEH63771.1 HSP-70 cofactor [Weeksella virosa]